MNGLLIGRFQPFHLGHLDAIRFALSQVEKLSVGIGSSDKLSEKNNPFSANERKEMILSSIDKSMLKRIEIYYIPDVENHENWIKNIDSIVPKFEVVFTNDQLTQFLYSKRGVKICSVPFTDRAVLSGTNIREKIANDQNWENLVPKGTKRILQKISAKKRLKSL